MDLGGAAADTSNLDTSSQRWVMGNGAGASWELDLLGRIRSGKAAPKADNAALEADYEYARQSLAAAVAAQDIRTAEQKAAAASYVGVALRAFEDVEDAPASDHYLRRREEALGEMVSASADSIRLGRLQLDQGQTDMFAILRLVGENLAAKVEYTKVRASRLRERVNLHLSLGGDFKGTGVTAK